MPFNGLKVHLAGAPVAAFSYLRLKSSKPFEDSLDGAVRVSFIAARSRLGQPADHYKIRHPLAAGLTLINDYRDRNSLTTTDPTKLITYLAKRGHVRVVQRSYDLGPLLSSIAHTPLAAGQTCLDEAIQDVENGPSLGHEQSFASGTILRLATTQQSGARGTFRLQFLRAWFPRRWRAQGIIWRHDEGCL